MCIWSGSKSKETGKVAPIVLMGEGSDLTRERAVEMDKIKIIRMEGGLGAGVGRVY